MKLTHKLFHRMTNRSCKLQGCSLIYTGMAKDVDVPVLSLTLGMTYACNLSNHCVIVNACSSAIYSYFTLLIFVFLHMVIDFIFIFIKFAWE